MIELTIQSAGYPKKEVLRDLSVGFEKGKLTSVIGSNGCGKSTLIKTILGITPCVEGEIMVNGENARTCTRKEVARRIAYLAQGKSTPDMTVEQMVLHGRFPHLQYPRRYSTKDREIARAAMERVGILKYAQESVASLSGGMRQNAYIAMALTQDTEYILLDEPTTYLDIAHQLSLMQILEGLVEGGKGVVAVMHDLPMAFTFSDEVVVMDGGKILAKDVPQKICKSGVLEKVFGASVRYENGEYFYGFTKRNG